VLRPPNHPASTLLLLAGLILLGPVTMPAQDTLLPQPAAISSRTGPVAITDSFFVSLSGARNQILNEAARHFLHALEAQTGTSLSRELQLPDATLTVSIDDPAGTLPTLDTDESYTLDTGSGRILLHAATIFGAMHGLQTLQQLVTPDHGGFTVPPVHIEDHPRFPWRGLLLDCSRHFMPLPVILRTLDGMAAVKLNVFHWHLTDDQGFRIESKLFPQLTAQGSDGLFYTQDQVREVIRYATARGIRVVPEFDMPGHVTSWLVSMPELGSEDKPAKPYEIERHFGVFNPAFDPTRESTYAVLDQFIGEMAALFPDQYLHLGGDESNGVDWKLNPRIAAFMREHNLKTTEALQTYFSTRLVLLVEKHHKRMIGWDEVLNPNTPRQVVIQSWRGVKSLSVAVQQGNPGILSAPYYLDGMKPASQMYLDDPLPNSGLTSAQQKLILGGETCMWAEQITGETVDSRIWPRAAALAERFWSPRDVRDVNDLYRRLDVESIRLATLGLNHISGPQAGLRTLAGSAEGAATLGVLTSVLTPVPFFQRYQLQNNTQLTAMDSLVDYTVPDPPLRQRLQPLVEAAVHAPTPSQRHQARAELAGIFSTWTEAGPSLATLIAERPQLAPASTRAAQLPRLGELGTRALSYLDSGTKPPTHWLAEQNSLLKSAREPSALTYFAILPTLQTLVEATAKP
jgi:hexosaminidase